MEARRYLVAWHTADGCDKGSTVVKAYDAEDAASQVEIAQAAAHGFPRSGARINAWLSGASSRQND